MLDVIATIKVAINFSIYQIAKLAIFLFSLQSHFDHGIAKTVAIGKIS